MAYQKFWIVTRNTYDFIALMRHETKEAAMNEAERLAREEGMTFLVFRLEAVCETEERPIKWHYV